MSAADELIERIRLRLLPDPQAAEVVQLRVFTGLTIDETAEALGIHPSAVNREWALARAWLKDRLGDGER